MFAYLKGICSEKNLDARTLSLEVNGIAYLIQTNLRYLNAFALDEESKVYTSMGLKESLPILYGFADKASRDIFNILTTVNGVGPKAALSILEVLDINDLIGAVLKDKPKLISEAQGVGPKTAKRIILELGNKLSKFSSQMPTTQDNNYSKSEDVSSILLNLGFSHIEVDKFLSSAKAEGVADDSELLIKYCLTQAS